MPLSDVPSLVEHAFAFVGQPGDLVAAKTELRITQRLRLDQNKFDDLERKLRGNVTAALTVAPNSSNSSTNGYPSADATSISARKQMLIPNQTKFSILLASPKIFNADEGSTSAKEPNANGRVKSEKASPPRSAASEERVKVKEEVVEPPNDEAKNGSDDEDEPMLSRLISYLDE